MLFVIQSIRHPEPETSIFRDGVGPASAKEQPTAVESAVDKA